MTRTLSRWLMSIALAVLTLAAINLLVATSSVQGRPATALVNCSGSIQSCIDAANDGDTILIAAGRYTESLTLSKPVSLTGEHRDTTIIHAVEGQRVLTVTGATISNSVVISGLTFTSGKANYGGGVYADSPLTVISSQFISNTASNSGGGLYMVGSTLILIDTDFTANAGGGVFAGDFSNSSKVRINEGSFSDNTNYSALSVYGSLDVTGTQFLSNTGERFYGAGISVYSGSAMIVNSLFENNHCEPDCIAGGLSLYRNTVDLPSLLISNTAFISNSPGGVAAYEGRATVIASRFERNVNSHDGGGMSLWNSSLMMSGTHFVSNTGGTNGGGGLYLISDETTAIANSYFSDNRSIFMGGGIHIMGDAELTNTQFISNTALAGGGAFVGGEARLAGGRFERNTATDWIGGGLSGGSFLISGTHFVSNTAGDNGGGVSAAGTTTLINVRMENNQAKTGGGGGVQTNLLIATNSQILSNTAAQGGGAMVYEGGRVVDTVFSGNRTISNGAAIAVDAPGLLDLLHTTIADTVLNSQPAIVVLSGTLNLTNTIIANHAVAISNTGGTVYEDYNLFFNTITNTASVTSGGHSLVGDPKFVDSLNGDYHLQFGSAAIDRGVDAGVYADLDGNPRPVGAGFDIGAYEYQSIKVLYLPLIYKH
jgi:predicted outer membrane repeat protein